MHFYREIALIKLIFMNKIIFKVLYCIPIMVLILSHLIQILRKPKCTSFQPDLGNNTKLLFLQLRKNMLVLSMKK